MEVRSLGYALCNADLTVSYEDMLDMMQLTTLEQIMAGASKGTGEWLPALQPYLLLSVGRMT